MPNEVDRKKPDELGGADLEETLPMELSELDLERVAGGTGGGGGGAGKVGMQDFSISKHLDKSTP